MINQINIPDLVDRLTTTLPTSKGPYALHQPSLIGNEGTYLQDCIDSGWVSSVGSYVNRFERMLESYTGAKHVIAVVNGTAALHICLLISGVSKNDEVISPSLTFVATANAITYCGATPLFADCEEDSLGIDPVKLELFLQNNAILRDGCCHNKTTGKRITALIAMHTFGHPGDIDKIMDVCSKWSIKFIEDAAESLGSLYKGRNTGTFGLTSAVSFNGNKIITTGGGGAILTNDDDLAKKARHITTTSKVSQDWSFKHDQVGYNYRLPNINAAIGCAQMESLENFILQKRLLADKYMSALKGFRGLHLFKEPNWAKSNYWLNTLILESGDAETLDAILKALNESGISARPAWNLMHTLPMYINCPRMSLKTAESLKHRIINIPSSANLYRKLF